MTQRTTEKQVVHETNLGAMLRTFMAMERYSMRNLAPRIGISSATLCRICAGYAMDADTLLKIVNWMVRVRV
jgi:plasmid maintenance system antidote protein VapI